MIFKNLKKSDRNNNNLYSYDKNEMLRDNNSHNNISKYIYDNNQLLINDNLNEFIKEKSYKNINNNDSKDNIFYFASFINSCKPKKSIDIIYQELCLILKSRIESQDYYYNIIHNYFSKILELISVKAFFYNKNNIDYLFKILNEIEIYMKLKSDNFYEIKIEILTIEKKINGILKNYIYYNSVPKCINVLKNNMNNIENSMKNNLNIKSSNNSNEFEDDEVIIHFDTHKKDTKEFNSANEYKNNKYKKKDFSKLNKAFLEDNSFYSTDYCSKNNVKLNDKKYYENNNINGINENKKKKKKECKIEKNLQKEINENPISYDYGNLMCPPIKSDSD